MTAGISEHLLMQLEEYVARRVGLHFPRERHRNLERGLAIAAKELHFADPASLVEALLAGPATEDHIDILVSALTVGETYFFREKRIFETLEERMLLEWISERRATTRHLRIWSAGCCTGEEAYSLAILIHRMIPDLAKWDITIIATDINARFIEKATAGIYSEWSFRGTPGWVKERYFKRIGTGSYEILPQIREMVTFAQLNLVENPYPSLASLTTSVDLILCRNVLMYFIPWQVDKVLGTFYRCLIDGGWLLVSPSEVSCLHTSLFSLVNFPGAMFLQKRQTQPKAAKATASSADYCQVRKIDTHYLLPQRPPEHSRITGKPKSKSQEPRTKKQGPLEVQEIIQGPRADPEAPGETIEAPQSPASGAQPGVEFLALYKDGQYSELVDQLSDWFSQSRTKAESPSCGYDPFALLVKSYANLGNLDKALSWCDRGIALDKLNPSLRYLRAVVVLERGQLEEASASLRQAIYLDPHFILGHFTLGNVSHKLGRIKESEKHFANTLRLLNRSNSDEIVPESDGMTVGNLLNMIPAAVMKEKKG
jgi:chemotaxis protein methyltransferase CheR